MEQHTASTELRMARPEERESLRAVWQDIFHDEAPFTDWLFTERFAPAFCPVARVDGVLAACAHGLPVVMRVRERLLPCALVGGVATLPDYRRRGLMHQLLGYLLRECRRQGIPLAAYRPNRLEVYRSLGHYPVCDMQYAHSVPGHTGPAASRVRTGSLREDASHLYRCYLAFSRRYSGILHRSFADFTLKLRDYAACGGWTLLYEDGGELRGYAVVLPDGAGLLADECAAWEDGVYGALYDGLSAACPGTEFTMRLPPDVRLRPDIPCQTLPKAVLGVADAGALLAAVGLSGGAVAVTDGVVPENNGVYSLDGRSTQRKPGVRLSAGRLAQWAVGYRSLRQLAAAGDAEIMDEALAAYMDSAGTRPCYIVDEY